VNKNRNQKNRRSHPMPANLTKIPAGSGADRLDKLEEGQRDK
jgi:hypothetical protein